MTMTQEEFEQFKKLPRSLKKLAACTALGMDGKELEEALGFTRGTINKYRTRLFDKLGMSSSLKVAVFIVRRPQLERMLREAL